MNNALSVKIPKTMRIQQSPKTNGKIKYERDKNVNQFCTAILTANTAANAKIAPCQYRLNHKCSSSGTLNFFDSPAIDHFGHKTQMVLN